MSGFKKRPASHRSDEQDSQRKFSKQGAQSKPNEGTQMSPAEAFLKYLIKARSVISDLDIKECISQIPMLLTATLDKVAALHRSVRDADQLMEAINELRAFNAREKVSRFTIAR